MAVSAVPKMKGDGKIELSTSARTLEVIYEEGNLSLGNLKHEQMGTTMILDRGAFSALRQTDFEPFSWSFTCNLTDLSDGTDILIMNVCTRTGACAADDSAFGVYSDVWGIGIKWTMEGTDHGDSADHTFECTKCTVDSIEISEGDPNTMSFSGSGYLVPTMT